MIGIINFFINFFQTCKNHMIWISDLSAGTERQIVIRDDKAENNSREPASRQILQTGIDPESITICIRDSGTVHETRGNRP
jgi:hypothetical protein